MLLQENLPNDSEEDSSHMESREANVTHPSPQLPKFPANTTNPEKGFFVVVFFIIIIKLALIEK